MSGLMPHLHAFVVSHLTVVPIGTVIARLTGLPVTDTTAAFAAAGANVMADSDPAVIAAFSVALRPRLFFLDLAPLFDVRLELAAIELLLQERGRDQNERQVVNLKFIEPSP